MAPPSLFLVRVYVRDSSCFSEDTAERHELLASSQIPLQNPIFWWVMGLFLIEISDPRSFQCYHDRSAVTDELVDKILKPGLLPGAVDVFLDFICYSGGPLPEDLLPEVKVNPGSPIEGYSFGILSDCRMVNDCQVLPPSHFIVLIWCYFNLLRKT